MPDPIVADATPAASSAAAASSPESGSDTLDTLSAADLHTWKMTGALPTATAAPQVETPPADSSPATPDADPAASTDVAVEATTEVADPALKPKTKERIDQVLADRAKERDRADRAEARVREIEAQHRQPPADARPAASSPAPAAASALVKPNPETYAYGTADPDYLEALTDYKVAATLAHERTTWEQGQTAARQRDESQRLATAFEAKAAKARASHADFDAVALNAPSEIPQGSAADLWVLEDDAGAEILYHLQSHEGERRRILALPAREQLKELVRLGDRLTATAPPARSTQAPPPPPTLSTRAAPTDALERAIRDDDTAAYNAEANRRDLAKLKL